MDSQDKLKKVALALADELALHLALRPEMRALVDDARAFAASPYWGENPKLLFGQAVAFLTDLDAYCDKTYPDLEPVTMRVDTLVKAICVHWPEDG